MLLKLDETGPDSPRLPFFLPLLAATRAKATSLLEKDGVEGATVLVGSAGFFKGGAFSSGEA